MVINKKVKKYQNVENVYGIGKWRLRDVISIIRAEREIARGEGEYYTLEEVIEELDIIKGKFIEKNYL